MLKEFTVGSSSILWRKLVTYYTPFKVKQPDIPANFLSKWDFFDQFSAQW